MIAASAMDGATRGRGRSFGRDFHHRAGALRLFVGDHAIRVLGQNRTGHHLDRCVGRGTEREGDHPSSLDAGGVEAAEASGEGGRAESVAVERDAVEGRQVAVGADLHPEHAAGGSGQRAILPRGGGGLREDKPEGFGGSQH